MLENIRKNEVVELALRQPGLDLIELREIGLENVIKAIPGSLDRLRVCFYSHHVITLFPDRMAQHARSATHIQHPLGAVGGTRAELAQNAFIAFLLVLVAVLVDPDQSR